MVSTPTPPAGHRVGRHVEPLLKEFTLEFGESDIYVKTANRVEVGNGHVLYEAILTDPTGSRTIYLDREEVAELLKEAFSAREGTGTG